MATSCADVGEMAQNTAYSLHYWERPIFGTLGINRLRASMWPFLKIMIEKLNIFVCIFVCILVFIMKTIIAFDKHSFTPIF